MIVGRGGGSLEDLWAFNEEPVAEAIFASKIPVVSAVGHEVDVTISDLVADKRALTPTEGATLVVPHREEMLELLLGARARLNDLLVNRLQAARQRWQALAERRAFRLPLERVHEVERRLDDLGERLQRAIQRRVAQGSQAVEALAGQLQGLSPLNVLARGYSLTRSEKDSRLVRDAAHLRIGDRIVTVLHQGKIVSRVEEIITPAQESHDHG